MSQFGAETGRRAASRQSAGFEVLKKFSSETATRVGIDFQGRLVRRDRSVGFPNDMEGASRPGWFFEWHNAYADVYDPQGRASFRVGRFYLPFGLNVRTDTHGTPLQLSNEEDFGFERDWQAGLWGALGDELAYNAGYLVGSGYSPQWLGQGGLGAGRLGLSDRWEREHGLEAGLSMLAGERLSMEERRMPTTRGGLDLRMRRPVPGGTASWTSEVSGGRDGESDVFHQLHQLDWLHRSRRWGLAAQFRRARMGADGASAVAGEATWYLSNDVGGGALHWFKLNVERRLERAEHSGAAVATLQYYRYW